MDIKDLIKKYNLMQVDCWELPQKKNTWIISHDACEKIAAIEKISVTDIQIISSEWNFCRLIVTAEKDGKSIKTIGEALLIDGDKLIKVTKKGQPVFKGNCESQYIGCMAEKRGVDRAILKLINAYEYGFYSESESSDFEKVDYKIDILLQYEMVKEFASDAAKVYFDKIKNSEINYTLEMYNKDINNLKKIEVRK